jgi:hypothetical protein
MTAPYTTMDARSYTTTVKAALRDAGLLARVTSHVTHKRRQTVIDDCAVLPEVAAVIERRFPDASIHRYDDLQYLTMSWPDVPAPTQGTHQ